MQDIHKKGMLRRGKTPATAITYNHARPILPLITTQRSSTADTAIDREPCDAMYIAFYSPGEETMHNSAGTGGDRRNREDKPGRSGA